MAIFLLNGGFGCEALGQLAHAMGERRGMQLIRLSLLRVLRV